MRKIHCLNPISRYGTELFTDGYEMTDRMEEADGILVRSASMHGMEFPESLRAVARAGAGVNNIPLDECAARGIVVFNTPGANANGVKELVIAGMLLAARDVTGGIGAEVANAAASLGMEVLGYDPFISVSAAWMLSRDVRHITDIDAIYSECDYITVHVPLLDSTRGMIGKESIGKMKDGVVILNFARDLLVNDADMKEALASGKVKRYVTDFPNPAVMEMEHVIATPHLGASTEESEDNCAVMAVKELMDYLENGNIHHSVNYPDCDMGVCASVSRVALLHRNIPNMIGQISAILAATDMNIANMVNKSRDKYAYTLIDLETEADSETIEKLKKISGMKRVRVIR